MNIQEVMEFLTTIYGKEALKEFVGLGWRDVYNLAYQRQQQLAQRMVDDDYLYGSERTRMAVLYSTIMTAAEKQVKNKDYEYNYPDPPEIDPDGDPVVVSGQVGTWASKM